MSVVPTIPAYEIALTPTIDGVALHADWTAKHARWAAQLHSGVRQDKHWVIPLYKVYDFVQWATHMGCTVRPKGGLRDTVKCYLEDLRDLYQEMESRPAWSKLYPFQRIAAKYLATQNRACLLDEMGLGKTASALMALPNEGCSIVVCPASLRLNWQAECAKWRPELHPMILASPVKDILLVSGRVYIVSPEWLTRRYNPNLALPNDKFAVAVFDEAHYYKNKKSKRTKSASLLSDMADHVWALTGTLMVSDPPDVQGVLRAFGLFNAAFCTTRFFGLQYGMQLDPFTQAVTWPEKPEHADRVAESLNRVAIRRTRAEVLPELPPKSWVEVVADINEGSLGSVPESGSAIERVYRAMDKSGTKTVPADWSIISRTRALLAEAKIPAMLKFVERFVESKTPLVVACFNTAPLLELENLGYPAITGKISHKKRNMYVESFQSGESPVIGIQLIAGGTGITLTRANHMLMVQRDWTPAINTQAEDRICRIGQTKPVAIYDLWANHPLDQRISRVVRGRQVRTDLTVGKVSSVSNYGDELIQNLSNLIQHMP